MKYEAANYISFKHFEQSISSTYKPSIFLFQVSRDSHLKPSILLIYLN